MNTVISTPQASSIATAATSAGRVGARRGGGSTSSSAPGTRQNRRMPARVTPMITMKPLPSTAAHTAPVEASGNYACGWAVNQAPNWWHAGSLPGTTALIVRTASGMCWAALANMRSPGMDQAMDEMMWRMARAVPTWRA